MQFKAEDKIRNMQSVIIPAPQDSVERKERGTGIEVPMAGSGVPPYYGEGAWDRAPGRGS